MSDLYKSERGVQPDACLVFRVDARQERVQSALTRGVNERTHQESADSLPAQVRGDINRILGGELITHAVMVTIQRAPAGHAPGFAERDEHGKFVLHVVVEPGDAMLQRARLVIVACGGVRHSLVVNSQNAGKILVGGMLYFHWDACSI